MSKDNHFPAIVIESGMSGMATALIGPQGLAEAPGLNHGDQRPPPGRG